MHQCVFLIKLHEAKECIPVPVVYEANNNKEKAMVIRTVQKTKYFAYTDQLILSMCADENMNVRKTCCFKG